MNRFDAALGEVNTRLKVAGFRCRIERRGQRLNLVATLPERGSTGRKQQRIPLGVEANLAGLGAAEGQAMNLGLQLRQGTFTWAAWAPEDEAKPTLEAFHITALRLFAERYAHKPNTRQSAWERRWSHALRAIPPSGELSLPLLLDAITRMPPRSAKRLSYGGVIAEVAAACGLDATALRKAATGYSIRSLQQRDIPEDAEIEKIWGEIRQPQWQWMFGMCAAYGLRPHEVREVRLTPESEAEVGETTKTGYRVVWPAPKVWVEKFDLHNIHRPIYERDRFSNIANRAIHASGPSPFPLYNLRHAYAIRLLLAGVPSSLAARLMGHGVAIHERVYQRWLNAAELSKLRGGFSL